MKEIHQRKVGKNIMNPKKRILMIAMISILLLTVGFTALKVWELKGPGDNPYKYTIVSNGNPMIPQEVYLPEYEKLSPGEALGIIQKKYDPEAVQVFSKPVVTGDFTELSSMVGDQFRAPSKLPEGYGFLEGSMSYKYTEDSIKAIIDESKNDNTTDYFIKKVPLTKDLAHYTITYRKELTSVFVNVFFDYPLKTIYDINTGQDAEIIKLKDFEAIYVEHDKVAELSWLETDDGNTTFFSIRTDKMDHNTMKNLILIAESHN